MGTARVNTELGDTHPSRNLFPPAGLVSKGRRGSYWFSRGRVTYREQNEVT